MIFEGQMFGCIVFLEVKICMKWGVYHNLIFLIFLVLILSLKLDSQTLINLLTLGVESNFWPPAWLSHTPLTPLIWYQVLIFSNMSSYYRRIAGSFSDEEKGGIDIYDQLTSCFLIFDLLALCYAIRNKSIHYHLQRNS